MLTKEERKAEFLRLMEVTSDLECTFLAGNPDGISICAYCDCWWHVGDIPKHTSGCNRPNQDT
jgi:hypothetical protein